MKCHSPEVGLAICDQGGVTQNKIAIKINHIPNESLKPTLTYQKSKKINFVEQLFYSDKYAWFSKVYDRQRVCLHYWFTCYILQ